MNRTEISYGVPRSNHPLSLSAQRLPTIGVYHIWVAAVSLPGAIPLAKAKGMALPRDNINTSPAAHPSRRGLAAAEAAEYSLPGGHPT